MVNYIQTVSWQQPMNCLNLFDHFVGFAFRVKFHLASHFDLISYWEWIKIFKNIFNSFNDLRLHFDLHENESCSTCSKNWTFLQTKIYLLNCKFFLTPKMSFMALVNKKLLSLKVKLLLFLRQTLVYII